MIEFEIRKGVIINQEVEGTFVEGVKEEVVLSPAHALSLIAAGEGNKCHIMFAITVKLNNKHNYFVVIRFHCVFNCNLTAVNKAHKTIESSPCGENSEGEAVNLSQLNLIDLAGSESSKAETTGVRRKEGSYINKSLLTLGTRNKVNLLQVRTARPYKSVCSHGEIRNGYRETQFVLHNI
ncbi:Kinesin-related protein 11 [Morus notabilis]|uniref:Kinesin-related protein 11 n=1 Tax=Morus notabilis TaxID=981085 RepID=W9R1H2_9ROSA|nr:Kinesin-related protein 11 [Morus notabilis]